MLPPAAAADAVLLLAMVADALHADVLAAVHWHGNHLVEHALKYAACS